MTSSCEFQYTLTERIPESVRERGRLISKRATMRGEKRKRRVLLSRLSRAFTRFSLLVLNTTRLKVGMLPLFAISSSLGKLTAVPCGGIVWGDKGRCAFDQPAPHFPISGLAGRQAVFAGFAPFVGFCRVAPWALYHFFYIDSSSTRSRKMNCCWR